MSVPLAGDTPNSTTSASSTGTVTAYGDPFSRPCRRPPSAGSAAAGGRRAPTARRRAQSAAAATSTASARSGRARSGTCGNAHRRAGRSATTIYLASQFMLHANETFERPRRRRGGADSDARRRRSTGGATPGAAICYEMSRRPRASPVGPGGAEPASPAPKKRPAGVREGEHRRADWLRLANVHPSRWCRGCPRRAGCLVRARKYRSACKRFLKHSVVAPWNRLAAGKRTVNRAPPAGRAPGVDVAAVGGGDGLHDRQAKSGAGVRREVGRAVAAHEAGEDLLPHAPGSPGPSSETSSTASPFRRSTATRISVPGRRVAKAVLEQVEGEAVKLVGIALDRHRAVLGDRQARGRRRPGAPRRRPRPRPRRGRTRAAGRCARRRRARAAAGRRRGGSSAATSGAPRRPSRPPRRRRSARRAAPGAARGWRGCWSAACGARARRRRRSRAAPGSSARSRSGPRRARGASGRACGRAPRPRRRSPARDALRGVAGGGDLAGGRGQRRDRPHRPPGDRDPGEGGEHGAAEHAEAEEEPELADRGLEAGRAARVLDEERLGLSRVLGTGNAATRSRRRLDARRPGSGRPRSGSPLAGRVDGRPFR